MTTRKHTAWTTRQLLGLSQRLSAAYGLNASNSEAQSHDTWTIDKLIMMSHGFAQVHGADLGQ